MFQSAPFQGRKKSQPAVPPRREPRSRDHFHAKDLFDSTHSQHFPRQGHLSGEALLRLRKWRSGPLKALEKMRFK